MDFFLKKGHSEIWSEKFLPIPSNWAPSLRPWAPPIAYDDQLQHSLLPK